VSDEADAGGRSAVGPFLVGLAVGAALGALFAPESGKRTRAKLSRRAGRLRDDVADVLDEVRSVLADDGEGQEPEGGPARSSRDALRERLMAARAARHAGRSLVNPSGDPPPA